MPSPSSQSPDETPEYLVSWISQAGFVNALDHGSAAMKALSYFTVTFGYEMIGELATPWWCYGTAMTTISLMVAMRELLKFNDRGNRNAQIPAETRRVAAIFMDQLRSQVHIVMATLNVVGRFWTPANLISRLLKRLLETLASTTSRPNSTLIDFIAERQPSYMLSLIRVAHNKMSSDGSESNESITTNSLSRYNLVVDDRGIEKALDKVMELTEGLENFDSLCG
ncbi:hypothetical protein HDU93_007115 [Gonapodya sp. JEL0774]|nr:hypothetical protein HDU93_007115 [Gonapodya sp. JEL0774]